MKFVIRDTPGSKVFDSVTDQDTFQKAGAIVYVYDSQQSNKDEACNQIKNII